MNQLDGITQKLIELDEDTLKAQLAIQEEEIADESTSRLYCCCQLLGELSYLFQAELLGFCYLTRDF